MVNAISYESFFELGVEGMLFATPEGIVLDANREACRALGWAHRQAGCSASGRALIRRRAKKRSRLRA